jgi:hypothetical protein
MAYLDLDSAEFLCEKLELLRDSRAVLEEKRQRYRSEFKDTVNSYFSELQKTATFPSGIAIPLLEDPVARLDRIIRILRDLIKPSAECVKHHRDFYSIVDDAWRQLVAHSKFAKWPDFGTFRSGHISLQGDSESKLYFRNIKIKLL